MTVNLKNWLPRFSVWLGLAAVAFPGVLSAQAIFFATDLSSQLYSVNASTQVTTLVGNTGVIGNFFEGLAVNSTGQLFGTTDKGRFYSINTTTGAASLIANTGRGDIEGLDFSGGTLYGITYSTTATIFTINTTTGVTTDIVTTASALAAEPRAIAFQGSTLYLTTDGSPHTLYTVNLSTGAVTLIGNMAIAGSVFAAMDFGSDGLLYGFNSDGGVYQINPLTAAVTLLGSSGSHYWLGSTALAVPEPKTWAMLAIGVGVIGAGWQRSRRRLAR